MDQLTPAQKKVAERIAELLAQSPLAPEVKNTILEGLDKMTPEVIASLLDSLEMEHETLESLGQKLKDFQGQQDTDWQQLEKDQKTVADSFVHRVEQEEENKARIQSIKDNL